MLILPDKSLSSGWYWLPPYLSSRKWFTQRIALLTKSNQSFNIPCAYPRHLRPLLSWGKGIVNQSSRRWGIWSPCISVGNLNHSLDYMLIICRLYYCLWDELDMLWNNFRGIERLWLCGQLATNKYDFIQCYCCIFKFCICQFIRKNMLVLSLLQ